MEKEEYLKIVKELTPKDNKAKNCLYAFLIGGLIGFIGEIITLFILNVFNLTLEAASAWTCFIVIFISCLLTSLGFFDNFVKFGRMGVIIPITGFAHSMQSAALDARSEGLVLGIGANMFKLAGTVILFGVTSVYVFGILRIIIGV